MFHSSCACAVVLMLNTTCSSAPVCDRWAPAAVRALTPDQRSAAKGSSGFHLSWRTSQRTQNRAFAAGEEGPGPFFLLPCSSLFLYIPLHDSLDLPASPQDPPCSQRCRSRWEEDSPTPAWCRPWPCLHIAKPAAGGQSQRLGRDFPDVGSGTSSIQHYDVTHKEATVSDTMAQRRDWDREESSIMTRTKEAHDVSVQERGRNAFKRVRETERQGKNSPLNYI